MVTEVNFYDYYPKAIRDSDKPLIWEYMVKYQVYGYYLPALTPNDEVVISIRFLLKAKSKFPELLATALKFINKRATKAAKKNLWEKAKGRRRPHLPQYQNLPTATQARELARKKASELLLRRLNRIKPIPGLSRKQAKQYLKETFQHKVRMSIPKTPKQPVHLLIPYNVRHNRTPTGPSGSTKPD